MIEQNITVSEEEGLHTRPANKFVRIVKAGQSSVTITKNQQIADGKSLLKIMKLGIVQGDSIQISCDGPDEQELMASIISLLSPGDQQS